MDKFFLATVGIIFFALGCGNDDHNKSLSVGTDPLMGPPYPTHYSWYTVRDANRCFNEFINRQIPIPPTATAQEMRLISKGTKGVIWNDSETTATPQLTVLTFQNEWADVKVVLNNKAGLYCITQNLSANSRLTIERSCDAKLIQINDALMYRTDKPMPLDKWVYPYQTINSQTNELPCIP